MGTGKLSWHSVGGLGEGGGERTLPGEYLVPGAFNLSINFNVLFSSDLLPQPVSAILVAQSAETVSNI